MPISSNSAFSDPGDFQSALRRCGIVRLTPAHSAGFRARLTDIRLNRLALVAGRENVSRIATVLVPANQVLLVFSRMAEGAHYWAERRLDPGELVVTTGAAPCTWRICAPAQWGAILLSMRMLTDSLHTVIGGQVQVPRPGLTLWRPRRAAFWQLLKLHRAVVRHTIRQPEASVEAETARGLEQELLSAVIDSLNDASAALRRESGDVVH